MNVTPWCWFVFCTSIETFSTYSIYVWCVQISIDLATTLLMCTGYWGSKIRKVMWDETESTEEGSVRVHFRRVRILDTVRWGIMVPRSIGNPLKNEAELYPQNNGVLNYNAAETSRHGSACLFVRPSVRPSISVNGTTHLLTGRFSVKIYTGDFATIYWHIPITFKIGHK
jgi:hypothetical protein